MVVGSRAQPRSVTASTVPVDAIPATDFARQRGADLADRLRAVLPSFNVNPQEDGDTAAVVRPAHLRGLAPHHTLVLVNGAPRTTCKLFSAMALLVEGRPCFPR